ncbi:hypothetical protein ONZ51_g5436 [Trametes cubensis]|uniref:Uncharacterized protein n=1 Tax=Trametes cubensis TaxID=1111947 RepID=A0AAD7TU50_9APHY|nr:hypothetical protein ONZ51_g5436 [Trametes cubensis]
MAPQQHDISYDNEENIISLLLTMHATQAPQGTITQDDLVQLGKHLGLGDIRDSIEAHWSRLATTTQTGTVDGEVLPMAGPSGVLLEQCDLGSPLLPPLPPSVAHSIVPSHAISQQSQISYDNDADVLALLLALGASQAPRGSLVLEDLVEMGKAAGCGDIQPSLEAHWHLLVPESPSPIRSDETVPSAGPSNVALGKRKVPADFVDAEAEPKRRRAKIPYREGTVKCRWIGCGQDVEFADWREHIKEAHIGKLHASQRLQPQACRWEGCTVDPLKNLEGLFKHYKDVHIRAKFLPCPYAAYGCKEITRSDQMKRAVGGHPGTCLYNPGRLQGANKENVSPGTTV